MAMKKNGRDERSAAAKGARKQEEGTHTPFSLGNEEVEASLLTGENTGLLEDYFGPEGYQEVRQLALRALGEAGRDNAANSLWDRSSQRTNQRLYKMVVCV